MPKQKQQMAGEGLTEQQQAALVMLGKGMGDPSDEFDRELQQHMDARHAREGNYEKMRAAETGGSELGPTEFAAQQQKQAGAMIQNQALQGAQQAAQAQAAQTSPQAAPAPAGPQGVSTPYPAQKPSQKGFGAPTLGIPADGSTPPAAPGPEEE